MSIYVRCPGKYSPCELDNILIPKNIKNMTYEQQCKYVISPVAYLFREQAKQLYSSMYKANYNIKRGSCANSFNVNWNSSNGKFTISGKSLANYYCHSIGSCKGFTGLLNKIIEWCDRQKYIYDLKKNGKYW
jgi:hypothetical protein